MPFLGMEYGGMRKRFKYFLGYLMGAMVIVPIASFIDFTFDINSLRLGVAETIGFSIIVGAVLGIIFGVVLGIDPYRFPWSIW